MIFNMVGYCYNGGSGGGASVDVITATLLPAAVVDGQAIIITSTTPGKIIFSYAAPSDPVSGDIWVHTVDNGGYTLSADGAVGIRITPGAALFGSTGMPTSEYPASGSCSQPFHRCHP